MTDTNELRAAAERLNRHDLGDFQGPTGDDYDMRCAIMLADAYIAEHSADDGEPITLNWLKTTNAELVDLTWQEPLPGDIRIGDLYLYGESFHGRWRFCIYMDGKAVGKIETRGDLRRLCAALGIELREGGEC